LMDRSMVHRWILEDEMKTAEKFRNMTDVELRHQERELSDQLFRLKFQFKMGQTDGLNKLRQLKKDVARVKTFLRERANGNGAAPAKQEAAAPAAAKSAKKNTAAKKSAATKTTKAGKR
jgi:large subunit ribosomal protein L29